MGNRLRGAFVVAAALIGVSFPAHGQVSAPDTPVAPAPAVQPVCTSTCIPKMTPVVIEILEPLGSKTSMSLAKFRIRLAEPVMVGEAQLVAKGTEGQGEVVHAKKAGGMGTGGELVLAARFLRVDGREMRLRSMKLDLNGRSRIDTVNAINVASAAAMPAVGLVGFFIKGGEIDVPAGTLASARVAEDFTLTPAAGPVGTPYSVGAGEQPKEGNPG